MDIVTISNTYLSQEAVVVVVDMVVAEVQEGIYLLLFLLYKQALP